jgi:hypothetical protein
LDRLQPVFQGEVLSDQTIGRCCVDPLNRHTLPDICFLRKSTSVENDGLMWLGRSLYSAQLNLDLPAQLVFASAEGEGCKLLCEFSGHKAPIRKVRFE